MTAEDDRGSNGLRFSLLGPLLVSRHGQPVPVGGRQQRAVLALLLVADGARLSASRIAGELWPGVVPPAYASTIQTGS